MLLRILQVRCGAVCILFFENPSVRCGSLFLKILRTALHRKKKPHRKSPVFFILKTLEAQDQRSARVYLTFALDPLGRFRRAAVIDLKVLLLSLFFKCVVLTRALYGVEPHRGFCILRITQCGAVRFGFREFYGVVLLQIPVLRILRCGAVRVSFFQNSTVRCGVTTPHRKRKPHLTKPWYGSGLCTV